MTARILLLAAFVGLLATGCASATPLKAYRPGGAIQGQDPAAVYEEFAATATGNRSARVQGTERGVGELKAYFRDCGCPEASESLKKKRRSFWVKTAFAPVIGFLGGTFMGAMAGIGNGTEEQKRVVAERLALPLGVTIGVGWLVGAWAQDWDDMPGAVEVFNRCLMGRMK